MSEATELSALASPESLDELPPRERVFALEEALKGLDNQLSIPEMTHHYIAGGVYVRELRLPAGTCATGYIHKHAHVVTLIGDISLYDENGSRRYTGVNVFTSTPGIKRAAYAHTDVHFITSHRMPDPAETDIKKLEQYYVTDTYDKFNQFLLEQAQEVTP